MDNKLFVGNLAWATNEDDLKQYFSQFGTVESAEVMRDKFTGRARGFGFVVMSTDEEAAAAVEKAEGVEFQGRPLKVNVARPREEGAPRERRSFGGNRGGFGGNRGGFGGNRGGFGGNRGGFGGNRGGFNRGGNRGPRSFGDDNGAEG